MRIAGIAGIAGIARNPTPESQDRAFRGPRSSPESEKQNLPRRHGDTESSQGWLGIQVLTTKETRSTPLSQVQGRLGGIRRSLMGEKQGRKGSSRAGWEEHGGTDRKRRGERSFKTTAFLKVKITASP